MGPANIPSYKRVGTRSNYNDFSTSFVPSIINIPTEEQSNILSQLESCPTDEDYYQELNSFVFYEKQDFQTVVDVMFNM